MMTDNPTPASIPTVRFAHDVVVRQVGDEALAINLTSEVAFSLNETAARVAMLMNDGLDLRVIIERLAREYGQSPEIVAAHIRELIEDFDAKGLIEHSDRSARP